MNHPDFRVGGRVFATLGYPDARWGMVKLFPAQQRDFVAEDPSAFVPVQGVWGQNGCTNILLSAADPTRAHDAIHAAWRRASVRAALEELESPDASAQPRFRMG